MITGVPVYILLAKLKAKKIDIKIISFALDGLSILI